MLIKEIAVRGSPRPQQVAAAGSLHFPPTASRSVSTLSLSQISSDSINSSLRQLETRASNQSVLLASLSSIPPASHARRTVFMEAVFIKRQHLLKPLTAGVIFCSI